MAFCDLGNKSECFLLNMWLYSKLCVKGIITCNTAKVSSPLLPAADVCCVAIIFLKMQFHLLAIIEAVEKSLNAALTVDPQGSLS